MLHLVSMVKIPFSRALFFMLAALHMSGQCFSSPELIWVTKPLLMPALALWLAGHSAGFRPALKWIWVALGFSTIGDILLMGARHATHGFTFFMAGIGAFLLVQIAYILAFGRMADGNFTVLRRSPWAGLLLVIYLAGFFVVLTPRLQGPLLLAVILYGIVLTGMVLMALNTRGRTFFPNLFTGACLFLVSDSLIAWDRFYAAIPYAGVWIMATYLTGQFLIAKGALGGTHHQVQQGAPAG